MSTDHSPEPEERPGTQRRRGLLPVVSVAAAVLLAGGGGAYWASVASGDGDSSTPGNGGGKPPQLALDGQAMAARGTAQSDKGGPGIAPGEPMGPRALRAAADLPDGPEKASVHRPERKAAESEVKDLAKALKLDGTPEKKDDHWEVTASGESGPGTPMLGVNTRDEGPEWAYMSKGAATGRCAAPAPGQEHLRGGGKPSAPGCLPGPGLDKGDPVSGEKAKDAVRPVLRTLGLENAELDAGKAVGSARTVTARPRLDDRITQGWDTTFMVNGEGRIVHAQGYWAGAEKGAEYPVMSASQTLNELNKARQAGGGVTVQCAKGMGGAMPEPGRADFVAGPPCGSGKGQGPEKVTGAAFGYAAQSSGGKPVLVPSWIFDVQLPGGKGTYPVAHPAVEPEFLKKPDSAGSAPDKPSATDRSVPSPDTSSGSGSGSDSDSSGEGGGGIGAGGGSGSSGTQALTSYDADGRTLTLTFWGGVCDKYEAVADESGSRVKLTLKAEPKDPKKKVCVKIAKRMTTKVTLDKALGDRKVVDTRDGDVLPRR